MTNDIYLPTPTKVQSDEEVPNFAVYELQAKYQPENFEKKYDISLCCGVSVIQYINITPNVEMEMRYTSGN